MDNPTNESGKSRRQFLSIFSSAKKQTGETEMVKMLTADGKLVEVSKAVINAAVKRQKATNKDIYNWMNNPSKENS